MYLITILTLGEKTNAGLGLKGINMVIGKVNTVGRLTI